MSVSLAGLNGVRIVVSEHLGDDIMVISPKTFEKMRESFGKELELTKETKESEGA